MANGSQSPGAELVWHWLDLRIEQEQSSSVMLVFPDTPRRLRLEEAMKSVGLRPICLSRATDALEILESDPMQTNNPVDLLVVFTKLSDLSGIDFAKFLRTRPYDPELVLVTPQPSTEEAEAAVGVRAAAYLGPEESDPAMLAARAKIFWEAGLTRRVRRLMVQELRALAETQPDFANVVLPRIDGIVAENRKQHLQEGSILVADPDPEIRRNLSSALQEKGLTVEVALGSSTALTILETESIDVLVTDPFAAEIPAPDFIKAVRLSNPSVDLVLLTAQRSLNQALEALKEGAADLILKSGSAQVVEHAAQRIAALVDRKNRMAGEELIIQALYEALSGYLAGQDAAARAARDRAFQGMAPAQPPPIPTGPQSAQGTDGSASTPPGPPVGSSHAVRVPRASRLTTMELKSGDYEVIDTKKGVATQHMDLPDAAVLEFIDEVLYGAGGSSRGDMGEGRRRLDRVERSVLVTFEDTHGNIAGFGYARDVSLGGLFVSAEPVPPVGTELKVRVFLPISGKLHHLDCQAKVAWSTASDHDKLEIQGPGFGLQFTVLSAEESELLRRFVTQFS